MKWVRIQKKVTGGAKEAAGATVSDCEWNMKIEKQIAKVEKILPMLATSADVAMAKSSVIKWGAGIVIVSTSIIVGVLFVLLWRP